MTDDEYAARVEQAAIDLNAIISDAIVAGLRVDVHTIDVRYMGKPDHTLVRVDCYRPLPSRSDK